MQRIEVARRILPKLWGPVLKTATASAPVNIALIKYWGKRDEELYLPVTDSFSLSLRDGTTTTIRQGTVDEVVLGGSLMPKDSSFHRRLFSFLDLFRPGPSFCFHVTTVNTVPTAAGLASSASGFAALVLALNDFFGWNLSRQQCSVLARLGSGSACRSVYSGFVRWNRGESDDGNDSFAVPVDDQWPELRLSVLLLNTNQKPISSTDAMRRTVQTSPDYLQWPHQVTADMDQLLAALLVHDFERFGAAAERNALAMHRTMQAAIPPVNYWTDQSIQALKTVVQARQSGVSLFATMDAGPNVKLLYLQHSAEAVRQWFPQAIEMGLEWPSWGS